MILNWFNYILFGSIDYLIWYSVCPQQVEDGGYESSVSQEKQDALSGHAPSDRPISLKVRGRQTTLNRMSTTHSRVRVCWFNWSVCPPVPVQTDKSGRVLLETPADLQNLLLLKKTKREQRAAVRRPAAPPAVHTVVRHTHTAIVFIAQRWTKHLIYKKNHRAAVNDHVTCDTLSVSLITWTRTTSGRPVIRSSCWWLTGTCRQVETSTRATRWVIDTRLILLAVMNRSRAAGGFFCFLAAPSLLSGC